jgi:UDP-GlcNAc3NAcA epimerase
MKILTVVGARPQFIKAGTLSRALSWQEDINEIIVHTGQHYDKNMSDVFFHDMDIPMPNYHIQSCSNDRKNINRIREYFNQGTT